MGQLGRKSKKKDPRRRGSFGPLVLPGKPGRTKGCASKLLPAETPRLERAENRRLLQALPDRGFRHDVVSGRRMHAQQIAVSIEEAVILAVRAREYLMIMLPSPLT